MIFLIEYKRKKSKISQKIPIEATSQQKAIEQFFHFYPKTCVEIISVKKI